MQFRYTNRDKWINAMIKKKKKKKKNYKNPENIMCPTFEIYHKQIHLRNYAVVNYFQSRRRHINQWKKNSIQLLPLFEGNMTICSSEAGNIARGRSPRVILHVEGEQIVMLPSHNGNNCFIISTCFIISFSL